MTQDTQQPSWTDKEWNCYNLGMQTEREHQNALSRLVMEGHAAELAALRQQVQELTAQVAELTESCQSLADSLVNDDGDGSDAWLTDD